MAKFQLLSAYINLAGDRDNVVYRGPDNPITFPEAMILRVLHGGDDHVHTLIVVGETERATDEERARLGEKYGTALLNTIFPQGMPLPSGSPSLPTLEEVQAAEQAAEKARAEARAKRETKPRRAKEKAEETSTADDSTEGTTPSVPNLDQLPE